jgi:hypothetical protein
MSILQSPCFWASCCSATLIFIMIIVLVALSIQVVEPTEYAVTYDTLWRRLGNDTYDQGRYAIGPTSIFKRFNNTYQPIDYTAAGSGIELTCMSNDGMWVVIDVISQYKVSREGLADILMLYDDSLDVFIKSAAGSTFIGVCSFYEIESGFLQNRQNISSMMLTEFQNKIAQIGVPVDTQFAELRNYRFNQTMSEAIIDKQVAQQQIDLLLSQRPPILTNAQTQYLNSLEQQQIDLQKAEVNANAIVTSAQSTADGKYNQWVQYTNGFASTLSKLNMNADTFVETYLKTYLLGDDANTNPLFVRL